MTREEALRSMTIAAAYANHKTQKPAA